MEKLEEAKKTVWTETIKMVLHKVVSLSPALLLPLILWIRVYVQSKISYAQLLTLTAVTISALGFLLLYVVRLRQEYKPNLVFRFGVRWDKKQNPYCPKCAERMGSYQKFMAGGGFICFHCNAQRELRSEDGTGSSIAFQDAIAMLKK